MKNQKLNFASNQSGYVALISAIIISVLLISLAFISSFTGYSARYNIFDSENKKISGALAEACAEIALLKLAADPNYPGSESVPVGSDSCFIYLISGSAPYTIRTQGIYPNGSLQESYSYIQFTVDSNFAIVSWQELPN